MKAEPLSYFAKTILKKIVDSKKPFVAYGLQIRTCKSLENRGLVVDSGGGYCPTHEGRLESQK